MLGGIPLTFLYADMAWGKAPEKLLANTALAISWLEALALAALVAFSALH